MKTIEQWWQQFEVVLSPTAPAVQGQEMRRAFYAGFNASLQAGVEMADESGDDDDLGVRMMEDLYQQCREFARAVERGEA